MEAEKGENLDQPVRSNWPVPQIDATRCDGCNLCVRVCPNQALRLEHGVAVVVFPDRCNYSGLCEQTCPTDAIQRMFEIVWPGEIDGEETPGEENDPTGGDP
ncbi:MAG: 4Fe-4S binding protein [Anaerolineae bacterium]|nr:4Fe-4S binding protein [Anaerolineae bacterium]